MWRIMVQQIFSGFPSFVPKCWTAITHGQVKVRSMWLVRPSLSLSPLPAIYSYDIKIRHHIPDTTLATNCGRAHVWSVVTRDFEGERGKETGRPIPPPPPWHPISLPATATMIHE